MNTSNLNGSRKLVVVGATGFIGRHLCRKAQERDLDLLAVSRSKSRARLAGFLNVVTIDELERGGLRDIGMEGAHVVHVAGATRDEEQISIKESIVSTTAQVIEAIRNEQCTRLTYVSGFGITTYSTDSYFRAKAEAEALIENSGIPFCILRCSYVLGEDDELTPPLFKGLADGLVELPGDGNYTMQPIWVDDLVEILVRIGQRELPSRIHQDLLGETTSLRHIIMEVREKVGSRSRLVEVPLPDWLRRSLVDPDPPFAASELALLVSGFVGTPTNHWLDCEIRGTDALTDELSQLFRLTS